MKKLSLTFTEDALTFFIVTKISNKDNYNSIYVNCPNYGNFHENINYHIPLNQTEISPGAENYFVHALSIDNLSVAISSNFILPIVVTK